jgi:starch synthase
MTQDRLLDPTRPGACNMLKGAIVYSNFVTTVSPTYMGEIRGSGGHGLQHVINRHGGKTGGVINGVDYNVWNPEVDRHIPYKFTKDSLNEKYKNKQALRERLWLRDAFMPIVAVISRLDGQKGVALIKHAIYYSLARGCQFVLLGTPSNAGIGHEFWQLKCQLNNNPDCHLELGYDEGLAHLIYAGADIIVVPSTFEPCGLTQLIAMKYGTVPVVRRTGGLADTVFDADYAPKPYHQRNGYVFNDPNPEGLESALGRAVTLWYASPNCFREVMVNGMSCDFSWNRSTSDYMNIYNHIRRR